MTDPHRFSDDAADSDLARSLREAQRDVLAPEAVARVQAGLVAAGIPAAGAPGAPGAAPRPPGASVLTAAGRWGIGVGLAGIGIAGIVGGRHLARQPTAWVAPTAQTIATEESPSKAPGAELPPETGAAAPTADVLSTTTPVAMGAGASRSRTSASPPSPREGALLLQARRALGTDPALALSLVHAHELEFPESQLRPERTRIAAEAHQRLRK